MDLKNKNLALNMIFSFAIFIGVILFPIGLFLEVSQTVVDGVRHGGLTTVQMFKNVVFLLENIDLMGDLSVSSYLIYYIFVFAFFACGITALIHAIFLIVLTIQGLVKPVDTVKINKHLVQFSIILLTYVCLLLGAFYQYYKDLGYQTIGTGPIILIIDSAVCFVVAAILHLGSNSPRAPINKVFDVCTSAIAYVAVVMLFLGPVMLSGEAQFGLIRWFPTMIDIIINSGSSSSAAKYMIALEFSMFAVALLAVASSFIFNVIGNGFALNINRRRFGPASSANPDYAKSSIVKSSLWLGFVLLGSIVMLITLKNVYESLEITLSPTLIICIVLAVISLGLSIANKVLQDKNKPTPELKETSEQQA